jgi:hypothetical protein
LNRHDAKAAKDAMFAIFPSKNAKPISGAFRSFVRCPPHDHFGFGDLGALAVDIFGLGLDARRQRGKEGNPTPALVTNSEVHDGQGGSP